MGAGSSPAASTASYQTEAPSPASAYNIGSVTSHCTGSDADSDSDNCTPQKLGVPSEGLESNDDFDFIAKVLYNHPTIQAVMANNL